MHSKGIIVSGMGLGGLLVAVGACGQASRSDTAPNNGNTTQGDNASPVAQVSAVVKENTDVGSAFLRASPPPQVNIGDILDTCPQSDPAYARIRSDFQIRRKGVLVGDIPCTEPISALPTASYTDELITLQGLRAIYYMDFAGASPPWTGGLSLYDWMKSKIGGFDLVESPISSCCETFDGRPFVSIAQQNEVGRDFDRGWPGLSGNIGLYAHEARHVDGFAHVSCCRINIPNGCDQTYDENALSPYGIQYWLNAKWLTGEVYVGFSCLGPVKTQEAADWHLASVDVFRDRFCDVIPPAVERPSQPGGVCRTSPSDAGLNENDAGTSSGGRTW